MYSLIIISRSIRAVGSANSQERSVHCICSYRLRPHHTLTREKLVHCNSNTAYIIGRRIRLITYRIKSIDREKLTTTNLKHNIECKNKRRREKRRNVARWALVCVGCNNTHYSFGHSCIPPYVLYQRIGVYLVYPRVVVDVAVPVHRNTFSFGSCTFVQFCYFKKLTVFFAIILIFPAVL